MKGYIPVLFILFIMGIFFPMVSAFDVVTTTTVLWDPVQAIGGDDVKVIYIAEPSMMHLETEKIPARIQQNADFIANASLFMAHNSTMDKSAMDEVDKFRDANGYGKTSWKLLKPDAAWNTPESASELADTVKTWLEEADSKHKADYEKRATEYKAEIMKAGNLTKDEKSALSKKYAIPIAWQEEPVKDWLGMNELYFYAPEFAYGGNKTPAKVVDSIKKDQAKIQAINIVDSGGYIFVVENMQSGEMGQGIEEALTDIGIKSKRVIFTNFPKSVEGVNSIPDVLTYNKGLILGKE